MQYLLLIYSSETDGPPLTPEERAAEMGQWRAVTAAMKEAGVFRAGEALQRVETATTVRVRDDKPFVTDGPFAETKEQLGGFYLIEVEHLDAALEWARQLPNARYGSVEVRPLMLY